MRRIVLMALVAGCAALARADWVWWNVDFTGGGELPWAKNGAVPNTAWLKIVDKDGDTLETGVSQTEFGFDYSQQTFTFAGSENVFKTQLSQNVVDLLSGTDGSDYLIYVELGNTSGNAKWNWLSNGVTYDQLRTMKAISSDVGTSDDASLQPWVPTTWTAVPEPCSGLLSLLGGALLALRRRRRA